jgi:hypothetical protein
VAILLRRSWKILGFLGKILRSFSIVDQFIEKFKLFLVYILYHCYIKIFKKSKK